MATLKVPHQVGDLGGYLKEQRESARLSLRQLASVAGVSNPYLSQIERGLRKPSAEVLQQIAKGLQISAEALFLRAGLLEESGGLEVEVALQSDVNLTARQKRVLLDIYATFRAENARSVVAEVDGEPGPDGDDPLKSAPVDVDGARDEGFEAAPKRSPRKRAAKAAKPAAIPDSGQAPASTSRRTVAPDVPAESVGRPAIAPLPDDLAVRPAHQHSPGGEDMANTSTPLFAVVGVTDLAVERVRAAAANASAVQASFEARVSAVQADVEKRVTAFDPRPA